MVIGVPCGVDALSSTATGGSLTGVTVIGTKVVSHNTGEPLSQTITHIESVPLKFAFGV